MKIRTDFVTNSSSSSFVVQLGAKADPDTTLMFKFEGGRGEGDFFELNFKITKGKTKVLASMHELIYSDDDCDYDDEDYCEYDDEDEENEFYPPIDGLKLFDIYKVNSFSSIQKLVAEIGKTYGLSEKAKKEITAKISSCAPSVKNLKNIVTMFEIESTSGDCPVFDEEEEFMRCLFGKKANRILKILNAKLDEKEMFEKFKSSHILDEYNDNSIKLLISKRDHDEDFFYGIKSVKETIGTDGLVNIEFIDWDV